MEVSVFGEKKGLWKKINNLSKFNLYRSKAIKYEIIARSRSRTRVEGYICPWEPVCVAKMWGFYKF